MSLVQRKILKWGKACFNSHTHPFPTPVALPGPGVTLHSPSPLSGHHAVHAFHSLSTNPQLLKWRDHVLPTFAPSRPSTTIGTQQILCPFLLSSIKIAIPSALICHSPRCNGRWGELHLSHFALKMGLTFSIIILFHSPPPPYFFFSYVLIDF